MRSRPSFEAPGQSQSRLRGKSARRDVRHEFTVGVRLTQQGADCNWGPWLEQGDTGVTLEEG